MRIKKNCYGILIMLVGLTGMSSYAGTFSFGNAQSYSFGQNPQQICKNPIPFFADTDSKRIKLAYTQKVNDSDLSAAIPTASNIITEMTNHLSPQAIEGLNRTRVVIYHCDPHLKSGLGKENPYNRQEFDYLSLLAPKFNCIGAHNQYKRNPSARTADALYGAGPFIGAVKRDGSGQLQCFNHTSNEICGLTTICDANLIPTSQLHFDHYPTSNILVHEFGHAIMNVGIYNGTPSEQQNFNGINAVYQNYLKRPNLCNGNIKASYACTNKSEMWAMATQTWFHANCRTDTNLGIATPADIKKHLPKLYKILEATYGPQSEIRKIPVFGDPNCKRKRDNDTQNQMAG